MSGLSTESFVIFLLFSIGMRTIAYNYNGISIVIGHKVENKFLIKKFLLTKCVYPTKDPIGSYKIHCRILKSPVGSCEDFSKHILYITRSPTAS